MSAREPSTRQLVTRGVAATAVIALVAIAAACNPFAGDGNIAELSIVAPAMPDGVQKGTPVDMRGETVGEVCKVDNSQAGSTRIGLCIDSTAMAALTPDTAASFVSRNLFGSDALRLIPTPDGQHLGEGATLMLTQPPADYTITAAVRSAGVTVGRVASITLDAKTYQGVVTLEVQRSYQFPKDTSAKILTAGLRFDARTVANPAVMGERLMQWATEALLIIVPFALGVVLASVLPALLGLPVMLAVFAITLLLGWWAWTRAPRPAAHGGAVAGVYRPPQRASLWRPWGRPAFRRLLAVFMLNGIASAIPATLVLFFIQDRLQAPPAQEPMFLAAYFVCAALSIPLWLHAVGRFGLARTWLAGMLLAIAVFVWTAFLGAGDTLPFLVVCALSGVALGTDLALPGALLAGVIAQDGGDARHGGAYFGWWNLAAKLNLALAAGLALPLLGLWGYAPGARSEDALLPLTLAYAVLPCALKLLAAVKREPGSSR